MDNSPPPMRTAPEAPFGQGPAAPPPPPPPHVKKAHRFLIFYIFILVAALLAGGIYAWQNSKVKNLNSQLSTANSQITDLKKQVADAEAAIPSNTNAGNAPNNPYAGWKTFCDDFSTVCLRYPKDWTINGTTSASKTSETFTNATNSAEVTYDNPYQTDSQEQVFYIVSINDLTVKNLGPKIVGRVLGNVPDFILANTSYIDTNHVTTGQTISFTNNAIFNTNEKKVTARLRASPTDQALTDIKSADQATAWLKTNNAKTSLKILQSLYYQ